MTLKTKTYLVEMAFDRHGWKNRFRANNAYKNRYFSGQSFPLPYDESLSALVWKEFKRKLDDALGVLA